METPSEREIIQNISIIRAFRILLSKRGNYSTNHIDWSRRTLSFCRGVFNSTSVAEAFLYLCSHGAATTWLLQVQLGLPEATAYRALKQLRALHIVEPILKLPKRGLKGSGPIPKVWGLMGNCTTEEVAAAINLHYRTLSPKYRLAVEVAQSMLDRYLKPRQLKEVSYREILTYVKKMSIPFKTTDVAHLTAQYLHEQGVKVWR